MAESVYKVGAIILKNKKLLVVKKRIEGRTEYIIPGGKKKKQEYPFYTLKRELDEELNLEVLDVAFFGHFDDVAIFENVPLVMDVYIVTYRGVISPRSEIEEYLWVDRTYREKGIVLGTVLDRQIIPRLISEDLM